MSWHEGPELLPGEIQLDERIRSLRACLQQGAPSQTQLPLSAADYS